MEKVVSTIVGLGIPGLVLLAAIASTGLTGGAAIVTTLALLGGPFGMLGGIVAISAMVLISRGITKYGFKHLLTASVDSMLKKGMTKADIIAKIETYPISRELKTFIKGSLED